MVRVLVRIPSTVSQLELECLQQVEKIYRDNNDTLLLSEGDNLETISPFSWTYWTYSYVEHWITMTSTLIFLALVICCWCTKNAESTLPRKSLNSILHDNDFHIISDFVMTDPLTKKRANQKDAPNKLVVSAQVSVVLLLLLLLLLIHANMTSSLPSNFEL